MPPFAPSLLFVKVLLLQFLFFKNKCRFAFDQVEREVFKWSV
jgi:hypothetical protein